MTLVESNNRSTDMAKKQQSPNKSGKAVKKNTRKSGTQGVSYKDAGVDLKVYEQSMARLPDHMHRTFSPRVMKLDGGFAGLFQLDSGRGWKKRDYKDPVLVSGTDGVGTKLKVAQLMDRHDTVGIDLVAMCVNDVVCCGAEPLFFLDYVAMSHDDPDRLEQIVSGISEGCLQTGCSLLGGETAIMPDLYQRGDYDLAGFHVGVVEKRKLIDGSKIQPGDLVLGLSSNGIHSNGFSLVRKIVFETAGLSVDSFVTELDSSVGDELLKPTTIYVALLAEIFQQNRLRPSIHGLAHITGGGLCENIERILPDGVGVTIDGKSWPIPRVFSWLKQLGKVTPAEMYRVFNMGVGMAVIVKEKAANQFLKIAENQGCSCFVIGEVTKGTGKVKIQGRRTRS